MGSPAPSTFSLLPVIVLPLLVGCLTLGIAVGVFALWLRMLPRSVCPCCGGHTIAVEHALTRPLGRWVMRRWCAGCAWSGWGRNGPVYWPDRGPVADGSGFRWGESRLEPDFGFRWKDAADARSDPAG